MRIIGGTHRRRLIQGPRDSLTTRPITDRVKQALFDRLIALEALPDAAVDLFSGTGSIGLEALSRGVDHVAFIERDRDARKLLEQNLETLDLRKRAAVFASDALSGAWIEQLPKKPVGLIFLDPPYAMMTDEKEAPRLIELIRRLGAEGVRSGAVAPDVVLVLRTEEHVEPPIVEGWLPPDSHDYGSMRLNFYTRNLGEAGAAAFNAG